MGRDLYIGIDVGSVSAKVVVLDAESRIVVSDYRRTHGMALRTVLEMLRGVFGRVDAADVRAVAVTGSGAGQLAEILGAVFVNEIVAVARAVDSLLPEARTVIEMGGEDSKLLMFDPAQAGGGRQVLRDFVMNTLCAAGTGSFLDQQATRLGVSIEREFGELALRSTHAPRIAGRCSVFAKSDMIHLQQTATPVHDIVAGLCVALARNFKATLGKGKRFEKPIAFIGGVAANAGMVRAFEEVLGLQRGELIVPKEHCFFGALGAIQKIMDEQRHVPFCGIERLAEFLHSGTDLHVQQSGRGAALSPLRTTKERGCQDGLMHAPLPQLVNSSTSQLLNSRVTTHAGSEVLDVYLGIDVGSISTNLVLIDDEHRVIAKRYLMTASRPIEAVRQGLEEIAGEAMPDGRQVGERVWVCGVGTTGSGRYLIGDLVGADVVRNEITAQATAALLIDPAVDTIFEIGGQDSKFISLERGAIVDFEMNKACAAGTGSFLEEQAERLGVSIKEEFAGLALGAPRPVRLGDRCTVFMESDLTHYAQGGDEKANLLAGLAYSIVENYLNRVVGTKRIGQRIFFQGGVAFNTSVVAAFESVLGKPVIVPPHHEVTGAIGAAVLAREHQRSRAEQGSAAASAFKGFDFGRRRYEVSVFECAACANRCEIRRVSVEGEQPLFYGSRCEKYEVAREREKVARRELPDLFAEREALLLRGSAQPRARTKGTVGLPFCLITYEFLPFWRAFFEALGFEILLSDKTNKTIIHRGVECVAAETCYPIKVAHGHILNLLDLSARQAGKKPDFLFLPNVIDFETPEFGAREKSNFHCPFVQALPYMSRGAIAFEEFGIPVLSPALHLQAGVKTASRELSSCAEQLGASRREIARALRLAYGAHERFYTDLEERGREVLAALGDDDTAVVLIGRPYNTCDLVVNLDVPKRLRELGILAIPMDMLPLNGTPLEERWRSMYWRYGQWLLKAAKAIAADPRLSAIYITNFGCGPDSFLLRFFGHELGEKPFLQIEIDEHSADAGIITRCEAFLDTLNHHCGDERRRASERTGEAVASRGEGPVLALGSARGRTVYLPQMDPHAFGLAAAMRASGIDAQVMDESDESSLELGKRFTSGRECYPALLTVGDLVRQTQRSDFDRRRAGFFMARANGPCRFGQYYRLHRLILDELGLEDVPIVTLDQDRDYSRHVRPLKLRWEKAAWLAITAFDALMQRLLAARPYETSAGDAQQVFDEAAAELCREIERGGDAIGCLRRAGRRFSQIPGGRSRLRPAARFGAGEAGGKKPLIGIVGEIYIRSNRFSNDRLVERIEALGGEVALPTMGEWVYYTTGIRKRRSFWRGAYGSALREALREIIQCRIDRRVCRSLSLKQESRPAELFRLAQGYVDPAFQGEAILSIGKALEYLLHYNVAGIINVMPFTCMPGTVVTALLKRLKDDYPDVPVLNLSYTGQQALNTNLRLEAFLHQCHEQHKRVH